MACDPHKPLLPSCSASPACVLLQPVTHSCLSCLLLLHSCRIVLLLPALVALMPCWCRSCLLLLHSCHTGAALACSSCPHAILVLLQLALVALMSYGCCSCLPAPIPSLRAFAASVSHSSYPHLPICPGSCLGASPAREHPLPGNTPCLGPLPTQARPLPCLSASSLLNTRLP